jgi:hypothetical protein
MQRFVPHGPMKSTMRYEVYRHKHAPEADFQSIAQMYRRVMSEDKALCEASQRNLNRGVFTNGEMHPRLEQGPLFFQSMCRDLVKEHRQREMEEGREIWPAKFEVVAKKQAVRTETKPAPAQRPVYMFEPRVPLDEGPRLAVAAA